MSHINELAFEHGAWYLQPGPPICYGCWELYEKEVPWPCSNQNTIPGTQ